MAPFQYELWPKRHRRESNHEGCIVEHVFSPRIVIRSGTGVVVDRVRNTSFYTLPGGKLNSDEQFMREQLDVNEGLQGLEREVLEEVGLDLKIFARERFELIGVSETASFRTSKKSVKHHLNVFWYILLDGEEIRGVDAEWLDLRYPGSKVLFPDSRAALSVLTRPELGDLRGGWIYPELRFVDMEAMTFHEELPDWARESGC